ncbi:glycosyltransferase [Albimonas sp. CAU 1670]|uniref:glycosyltransferase family 2 protein n=1 Tax=Albimonas sp. CAU 1670 TaxID=3032599 RepID=UPI0023DA424C|nr:glycosyltransferase [Albimonas sp. CAU 1670]MDF2234410.1 glycosyltransferase [Albimonas sp. CAU 1670]
MAPRSGPSARRVALRGAAALAPSIRPRRPPTERLGALLVRDGGASELSVAVALRRQRRFGAPLGEILVAHGLTSPEALARAVAAQQDVPLVDLARDPPDPELMAEASVEAMVAWRAVPWRRDPSDPRRIFLAAPDPARLLRDPEAARRAFDLPRDAQVAVAACSAPGFDAALLSLPAARRADRAARRTPAPLSARGLSGGGARLGVLLALLAAPAAVVAAPGLALAALFLAALTLNAANMSVRIAALLMRPERRARRQTPPAGGTALLPCVTLLIPLYKEPKAAPGLIDALRRLDYPAERLDVILAVEADDPETCEAIAAADPPPWLRVIPAPPGAPRTKPRALNHALDFARGTIVGVYDAEDRPEPQQLRKAVEAFARAPPRVACLQARLRITNGRRGWLARCFAMEYATWFHLVLPALARLGAPIPLAGTSLFLRRRVLERLGAWDAWNVTEDADLGVRLARAGYETRMFDSDTGEEAVTRLQAWLRQRSRWQKGYFQTWLTHMRDPIRLWGDLGWRGFLGMQIHFVGAGAAFLSQPLFWTALLAWPLVSSGAPLLNAPGWLLLTLLGFMHAGQGILVASVMAGLRRAGWRASVWKALPLLGYWPLATLAAFKALVESVAAPAFWDKTGHGAGPAVDEAPPSRAEGGRGAARPARSVAARELALRLAKLRARQGGALGPAAERAVAGEAGLTSPSRRPPSSGADAPRRSGS